MDRIEQIMQNTGMERLQAMRHEQQRLSLARAYANDQRQRAADCAAIHAARRVLLVSKLLRYDGQPATPKAEVWRATLRRSRWWGLRAPLVITTNKNPSPGDALHDLRAMVATVTGRAFCVRRGDVVSVARVGAPS